MMLWGKVVLGVALGAAIVAGTRPAVAKTEAGVGFLTIRDGEFYKDGRPFSVRANCCDPAVGHWFKFKGPWLETGIERCKQYGFNAIRTWVPGTGEAEKAATYDKWQADRAAFYREFDRVFVNRCKAEGIYLIFTLTRLPSSAAPGSKYDVEGEAYEAWKRFAQDFCGHYRDEPWILFWEVANEYRGDPDSLPETRRFYEQAARDLRAADPNHLISSGVNGLHWPDYGNSYNVWLNINRARGIDIASSHAYTNDPWTYNWHTERDYVRMVREQVEAAGEVGKPLFLGEFGAEPRLKADEENPEIIWYMKAIIRQGIRAYGFHWFYPVPEPGTFRLIPERSPRTAEWMKELNALVAEGREVPEDFGPKTTDYAFPICTGAKPFAGPAPRTRGRVEVEADDSAFGEAPPSLRITWETGGGLELGPYHPNDLSEYFEAGGSVTFGIRSEHEVPGGLLMVVTDKTGRAGKAHIAEALRRAGLAREWTKVSVPMKELQIDWSKWQSFGLEFPPDTLGCINIDDIEIGCRSQ